MTDLIELFSGKPKGLRVEPKYLPMAGEVCLASGPNEDNAAGYVWGKVTVYWRDDIFVLYGIPGNWPVLHKLDHVLFEAASFNPTAELVEDVFEQNKDMGY